MDYLSKKGFVHRDLAARNILVAANKLCKVMFRQFHIEVKSVAIARKLIETMDYSPWCLA